MIALDMQPVPVIDASSGWPLATASTLVPSETWSTGPVTDATTPSAQRRLARELGRIAAAGDRLDAAHLGLGADERRHLAGVAAQHRHVDVGEDPLRRLRPVPRRPGADRVEDDRHAPRVGRASGEQHRVDPGRRERADVEHERAGEADHLLDLLGRVRHHRQRAQGERGVGRLVHDDVVRDLVDERLALAQLPKRLTGAHGLGLLSG